MSATQAVGTVFKAFMGEPATYDAAGFKAAPMEYVAVGEVTEIPTFGGSAQVITHIPLATGIIDKTVGSIDYGEISVPMASLWSNAGQVLIKKGFDGVDARKEHSFMIETDLGDLYFTGKITGVQYTPGDANANLQNSVTIAITGKIVEDLPA